MIKYLRYGLALSALALPLIAQAEVSNNPSIVKPDFEFTLVPVFANAYFPSTLTYSGIYKIRNNTPVPVTLKTIQMKNLGETVSPGTTTIVAAPTNSCVAGTKLAGDPTGEGKGGTCNIQVNLKPQVAGTFNRVLEVYYNTRQVALDSPVINSTVTPMVPSPPPVPPTPPGPHPVPPSPSLYSASIIGASTVMSTGPSLVNGDVDVSPGSAVTGFPPAKITNGIIRFGGDPIADKAHADALTYYNSAVALSTSTVCPGSARDLTGKDLGGMTLAPGVYCFSSSAQLTGTLTLTGDVNSAYTFVIGSTLTTASNSKVVTSNPNPVSSGNITWAIGSSATLEAGTVFQGIIDATTSITLNNAVSFIGRAWALNGAVTLDTDTVTPN